jgi:hypothetical protein
MAQDKHLSGWLVIQHYIMRALFLLVPEVTLKNNNNRKEAKLQETEQS